MAEKVPISKNKAGVLDLSRMRPGRGILIVDPQGFGDLVVSIPLLKAVCQWAEGRWPVRAIFQSPHHFELIQEEGLKLTPIFLKPVGPRGVRDLAKLAAELRGTSDLIIALPEVSTRKVVALKLALGSRYAVADAWPPYDRLLSVRLKVDLKAPIFDGQREILKALGIDTPLGAPSIRLTPGEREWAERKISEYALAGRRPLIALHSGSRDPWKRWPAEHFGKVIQQLHQHFPDMSIVSFGTAVERAQAEEARKYSGGVYWVEGTGQWTVRQSLAMLSRCELLLSGDTGVMHMAAAVGTRTVSVFGPTSPTRRAPTYNAGVALAPNVPCHPCFPNMMVMRTCTCIRLVDPHDVAAMAERCLDPLPASAVRQSV